MGMDGGIEVGIGRREWTGGDGDGEGGRGVNGAGEE